MKELGIGFMFCLCVNILFSQNAMLTQATESYNKEEWENAISNYQKYLSSNPADSSAFFNLGVSFYQFKQYEKSLAAFRNAKRTNFNPVQLAFHQAKVYGFMKKKERVISLLNDATSNGFPAFRFLQNDAAFAFLRKDTSFVKIISKAKINAHPCLSDPERRKFDFWLGDWDVYVGNNKVGENKITMGEGGCSIHETYTTPSGYAGQSINYYDPEDQKWRQNWVGSARNNVYKFEEIGFEKGKMIFQDDVVDPTNGTSQRVRMTFTYDPEKDTVLQYIETSNDEGKTWTAAFNGLYVKMK